MSILLDGLNILITHWLPIVLPVWGGLTTHVCLVTWRVVFEQAERRRVKSIFSTVVSPKIVNELLETETLSLEGARRGSVRKRGSRRRQPGPTGGNRVRINKSHLAWQQRYESPGHC